MTILDLNVEALTNIPQTVRPITGKNLPTQSYCAELVTVEVLIQHQKLFLDKVVIEAHVVRHEPRIAREGADGVGNLLKYRRILYHLIIDTRELGNERRNEYLRVDQRLKRIDNPLAIVPEYGNLGNAPLPGRATRSFNIDDRIQKE